jgi:hypothetical protein
MKTTLKTYWSGCQATLALVLLLACSVNVLALCALR